MTSLVDVPSLEQHKPGDRPSNTSLIDAPIDKLPELVNRLERASLATNGHEIPFPDTKAQPNVTLAHCPSCRKNCQRSQQCVVFPYPERSSLDIGGHRFRHSPRKKKLFSIVNEAFAKMGPKLGCTTKVQHVIKTDSPPIRQGYYPISPALQKQVNEKLHKMLADDIFLKLAVKDRMSKVKHLKLCINCLRGNHEVKACRVVSPLERGDALTDETVTEPTTCAVTTGSSAILSTVLIHVLDKNHKKHSARALLDCGSQSSFISKDLADTLNLDKHKTSLCISGISNNLSYSHLKCVVKVFSSQFWQVEEVSSTTKSMYLEERLCEQHFSESLQLSPTGKYVVSIPFKGDINTLGKKIPTFRKKPSLKSNHEKTIHRFMREYENLGHMTMVTDEHIKLGYFMPHHGVLKKKRLTTKLRTVFNASSPSTTGVSLNSLEVVGPILQSHPSKLSIS
nr:unnamed protein product [Callosobruchus analis]